MNPQQALLLMHHWQYIPGAIPLWRDPVTQTLTTQDKAIQTLYKRYASMTIPA
jgi:hypothetical protein